MPLYEYRCLNCGYKFEKIQKFSDQPESVCPKCQGELVRPVTAPALKFEGAGWYINDYAAKGGAANSGETKSESKGSKASAPAASAGGSGAESSSGSAGAPASGASGSGSSSSGSSSSGSSTTAG